MIKKPIPEEYLGLCPICTDPLRRKGDLAECPSGDYAAPALEWLERWKKYSQERNDPPEGYDPKTAAEELLFDLQEMNTRRKNEESRSI